MKILRLLGSQLSFPKPAQLAQLGAIEYDYWLTAVGGDFPQIAHRKMLEKKNAEKNMFLVQKNVAVSRLVVLSESLVDFSVFRPQWWLVFYSFHRQRWNFPKMSGPHCALSLSYNTHSCTTLPRVWCSGVDLGPPNVWKISFFGILDIPSAIPTNYSRFVHGCPSLWFCLVFAQQQFLWWLHFSEVFGALAVILMIEFNILRGGKYLLYELCQCRCKAKLFCPWRFRVSVRCFHQRQRLRLCVDLNEIYTLLCKECPFAAYLWNLLLGGAAIYARMLDISVKAQNWRDWEKLLI